jgi:biotin synthase
MTQSIDQILQDEMFTHDQLVTLLNAKGSERTKIFAKASEIKKAFVGNKVYFRGLVELSNICSKNCLYCGIRSGNKKPDRYMVTANEVYEAARFASENGYGSMVLQSGERCDEQFISIVSELITGIKKISDGKLGITLSMGEQSEETYRKWFELGAHRYLLRIETSNRELYYKIHPENKKHDFDTRLQSLQLLRKIGYNVGSGVMIGLPFQTIEHLSDDLLFLQKLDVDMVGMGPFIEHEDTPLFEFRNQLWPKQQRFDIALLMVAILRIMMKNINIAATTAMQAIDKQGREKALKAGANIIMPNLTPVKYREDYLLYEDKPCMDEDAADCRSCLEARIHIAGDEIGYNEWGDSKHFTERTKPVN